MAQNSIVPAPGDLWGSYRIEHPLGSGGMGVVLAARDERHDRPVALKLLRRADERAMGEARALAALDHTNIVRIYGFERACGRAFVVMERVDGRSLEDVLRAERCMPVDAVVSVVRSVASALTALHREGRLHGDVKPSNILIENRTGRVVLTDFDLSRRIDDATTPRSARGTPEYLAPERARSESVPRELRAREDVYALAATAFDLLTGRPPFEEDDVRELLRRQASEPPPPPSVVRPSLSWRIDRAILAALEKSPYRRTPTALAFANELADASIRGDAPPHVLVADDDGDHRQVVSLALQKRLRRVTLESVADGELAYHAAIERAPDLAILDLDMPGLDGLELAVALRALPHLERLPIIVVSGRVGPSERESLARAGVSRCFEKPVMLWRLASAARELLGLAHGSGSYPHAEARRETPTLDDPA